MVIHLNPEQENRVAEALRAGAYRSADDVIDRALEALHEQDEWLAANREAIHAKIHQGLEELERGEGIPEDAKPDQNWVQRVAGYRDPEPTVTLRIYAFCNAWRA